MTTRPTGTQSRVLVVEDDRGVAMMLRFCLHEAGFDVTQVATGGEALRSLEQQPSDAVVLDLGLPDGLGGAVLDWLRQFGQRASNLPVWVVMSALDRGEIAQQYGPMGDHFLDKPFDPWDLVRRLEAMLSAEGDQEHF